MPDLDTCGCCDPEIPASSSENPPGQPALRRRPAPYGEALRRMVARLPRATIPAPDDEVGGPYSGPRPLARLTTRAPDDPAMALLDSWAVVTEVLSFYQERIANEGYLRTATERRSVLELARAIGYELNPGVAASAFLAFTVDESPGAPGEATIPAGTQVQSIPAAADELPQTFESGADFVAYVEWNRLRPRQSVPQVVTLSTVETLYFGGAALNLKPGSVLLLLTPLASGYANGFTVATVKTVESETALDRTRVTVTRRRHKAASGGTTGTPPLAPPTGGPLPFSAANAEALVLQRELTESEVQAILSSHGWKADDLLAYANERRPGAANTVQSFAMRERAAFFGHNAPLWGTLPSVQRYGGIVDDEDVDPIFPVSWDSPAATIWTDSQKTNYEVLSGADVALERVVSELLAPSWAIFAGQTRDGSAAWELFHIDEVREASLADYALSAKLSELILSYHDGDDVVAPASSGRGKAFFRGNEQVAARALDDGAITMVGPGGGTQNQVKQPTDPRPQFLVRRTTAHLRSEPLTLAPLPLSAPILEGSTELQLDRLVLGLAEGQPVALSGEQWDAPGSPRAEVRFVERVTHHDGLTTIELDEGLEHGYGRESLVINANVVAATHGERVPFEVLGGGDSSQPNQRFTLKKPPLTYVSAATPTGAASTLEVRVNRILWQPAPSLYGLPPESQSYTVRHDDDGNATVIFGDGTQGARPPTGLENITATYRKGLGAAGEVGAGALSLLKSRPFGVRSVTNPLAANGGADAEALAEARHNAPLTVLALGRIVSLRDFEDFARAFAGIGKAKAISLWSGERQRAHLTIADSQGEPIATSSDLYKNLVGAIAAARDPLREIEVESFEPLYFAVSAKLLRDPTYLREDVEAAAQAALAAMFAFAERDFGQPVTSAEVIAALQGVAGVLAVDLDRLQALDGSGNGVGAPLNAILAAQPARYDAATRDILPAQLLLLHPQGVALSEWGGG